MSEKIRIFVEYSNFSNVFSSDSTVDLSEYIGINDYHINLPGNKQISYGPICSLGLVELEILKTYIKANLASSFIKLSKSSSSALVLFVRKKNSSLNLCVDYQGPNNLIIKNCYLLSLINKLLDCLSHAKHFTQLDLVNVYH